MRRRARRAGAGVGDFLSTTVATTLFRGAARVINILLVAQTVPPLVFEAFFEGIQLVSSSSSARRAYAARMGGFISSSTVELVQTGRYGYSGESSSVRRPSRRRESCGPHERPILCAVCGMSRPGDFSSRLFQLKGENLPRGPRPIASSLGQGPTILAETQGVRALHEKPNVRACSGVRGE